MLRYLPHTTTLGEPLATEMEQFSVVLMEHPKQINLTWFDVH